MKKTLIASLATIGLFSSASAYTISFLNVNSADETAVPILDNTGTPIARGTGYVAAGTFAVVPGDDGDVRTTFVPFGTGDTSFSNGIGVEGFFDGSRSEAIPEGTVAPPVGQNVYLVIGDGDALLTSTNFAVYDPGLVVGTENAVGAGALDIIIDDTALTPDNLILGTLVTNVDTGIGVTFNEGIQLGAVPEPSTSLLAALAGLALAARRRR